MARLRTLIGFLTVLSAIAFVMLLFIYIQLIEAQGEIMPNNLIIEELASTKADEIIIEEEPLDFDGFDTFTAPPALDVAAIEADFELPPKAACEDMPLILQNPELPRGCEVTSLAMLINYFGTEIDKMTLASEIKKDDTPREIKGGVTYWGNPNNGFIGSMYDMHRAGFGVYHAPIFELLSQYFPERAIDITGASLEDLQQMIAKGSPVWVIINTRYEALPESSFRTWMTPDGEIQITYSEHAAVLIGYDEQSVYLNDPLFSRIKISKKSFLACFEQMGSQAITVMPISP